MTRNTAREIATHLAYELSFTDLPIPGEFCRPGGGMQHLCRHPQ